MAALGVLGAGFGVTVGAPTAQADPPYANCKAAAADGRYNIPRGTCRLHPSWTVMVTTLPSSTVDALSTGRPFRAAGVDAGD